MSDFFGFIGGTLCKLPKIDLKYKEAKIRANPLDQNSWNFVRMSLSTLATDLYPVSTQFLVLSGPSGRITEKNQGFSNF